MIQIRCYKCNSKFSNKIAFVYCQACRKLSVAKEKAKIESIEIKDGVKLTFT